MARVASTRRELPPPLPPESRTVGQLVGEAIRIYGRNVWKALAIGLPVALVNALVWAAPDSNPIFVAVVGALLATLSYVVACSIVTGQPLRSRGARRRVLHRRARLRPFSTARNALHPSRPDLAVALRPRGSGRARRGSRCARISGPRGAARPGGLHPRTRRLGHARDRGVPHAGLALLRPSRVRREHESRRRDAGFDRRVAARVSRGRAPVRRPDRSIRLTPRATKGARCRPT